jgi:hypothetical protein
LIRFALTAVQRHDQSRHGFQQLARPVHRCQLQLLVGDHTFASARGGSQQFQALGRDRDLLQGLAGVARNVCRRRGAEADTTQGAGGAGPPQQRDARATPLIGDKAINRHVDSPAMVKMNRLDAIRRRNSRVR